MISSDPAEGGVVPSGIIGTSKFPSSLSVTFNQPIQVGSGTITLTRPSLLSPPAVLIPVTVDISTLSSPIVGNTLTIPNAGFQPNKPITLGNLRPPGGYKLSIPSGAVTGIGGSPTAAVEINFTAKLNP
ncbi:MAG: copper resistance protein CopC [Synechococcaceae cyanobacterium SM2_3_2]|nr:copper resistance protein CopC [Synechococcaceae cyanobacterium SM2_3_2]